MVQFYLYMLSGSGNKPSQGVRLEPINFIFHPKLIENLNNDGTRRFLGIRIHLTDVSEFENHPRYFVLTRY